MKVLLLVLPLVFLACGETVPAKAANALDARCSDEPVSEAGQFVTMKGCSFVQQQENIAKNGAAVAGNVRDGTGVSIATAAFTCGSWILAKDPNGLDVIIHRSSGDVRSHGLRHSGESISALPTTLSLPLEISAP